MLSNILIRHRNIMYKVPIFLIMLISFWLCDAVNSGPQNTKNEPYIKTMKSVKEGMQLFMVYCAICHGNDGKANIPQGKAVKARNLVSGKFKKGGSVYGVYNSIKDGIPGTQMAGGLVADDLERWKISHFVEAIRSKKVALTKQELEELKKNYQDIPDGTKKKISKEKPRIYKYRLKDLIQNYVKNGGKIEKTPSFSIQKIDEKSIKKGSKIGKSNPEGEYLYRINCQSCHGKYGEGRNYKILGINPIFSMITRPFSQSGALVNSTRLKMNHEKGVRGMLKPSVSHISDDGWRKLHNYLRKISK